MTIDDEGLERDPQLGAWLARVEAPAQADVDRLARRVSAAVRAQWVPPMPRTWRTEAASWSRMLVPLAAAAGIAAAVVVNRIGVPASSVATATQDSTQLLDVLRRTDGESYLVTVAVTNYRDDWANSLVGSAR
jgi:negative regulator of sigma E activity